jgi:hypothetical protein
MPIGGAHVPAKSELEVYCFILSKWCIEYRVSEPKAAADGSDPLAKLQAVLPIVITSDR